MSEPLFSGPADRNKDAILHVLQSVLPANGVVLEVATGTGQHIVHFAQALTALEWQPSDIDLEYSQTAGARISEVQARGECLNIREQIKLDVCGQWPQQTYDAIVCANMLHISPVSTLSGLLAGAATVLSASGVLVVYGPFKKDGEHTAPSNLAFDQSLRSRNPDWGIRDLEMVASVGSESGLDLTEVIAMPANNFSLVLTRNS